MRLGAGQLTKERGQSEACPTFAEPSVMQEAGKPILPGELDDRVRSHSHCAKFVYLVFQRLVWMAKMMELHWPARGRQ